MADIKAASNASVSDARVSSRLTETQTARAAGGCDAAVCVGTLRAACGRPQPAVRARPTRPQRRLLVSCNFSRHVSLSTCRDGSDGRQFLSRIEGRSSSLALAVRQVESYA
ncbi:hypothetical protein EVAR_29917_1 [Eumeta japonica]|uniref:Uncharacterized protein n=1 Tax=Eumeta variegata TaxID=151549 RepID=A0A4C1V7J2_EUMVA|nr:hypothetical protein EVAR_29917_1 [Eumeta japonica]